MTLKYDANVIISCIDFSLNGKSPYHANKFGNIASEEFIFYFLALAMVKQKKGPTMTSWKLGEDI